jgi:hypothetical protein
VTARRTVALGAALLGLVAVGAGSLLGPRMVAESSALSSGPRGYRAARRYLELRDRTVALLDAPVAARGTTDVLVIAFPWQLVPGLEEERRLFDLLGDGATILLVYSGAPPDPVERHVFRQIGLDVQDAGGPPPRRPWLWRAWAARELSLAPDRELGAAARPLAVSALRSLPVAPKGARCLYRTPDGSPAVFEIGIGRGHVLVLPAEALANARLQANADLLETLAENLGRRWSFDEFHHGLAPAPTAAETANVRVMDLWLVQLALLYVLALVALARRFGPAWREPPVIGGSAASFLRGLGGLHDRLGHHAEAARLLTERARALDPRLVLPARREEGAKEAFLEWAREVGARQARRGSEA